jgi:hypothetical protein
MRVQSSSPPKNVPSSSFDQVKSPTPLQALIGFLNWDLDRLSGRLRWEALPLRAESEEQFREAQGSLRKDILSIIEPTRAADMEANLRQVVAKIDGMKLVTLLGVWCWEWKGRKWLSGFSHASLGRPFEINGVKFFTVEGPRAWSFKEIFYWLLFNTLRSGEFSRLRKCLRCPKFFVAKDLKRKFCSDRCKDEYHGERRKEEGYFTKLWRGKRKTALVKAKVLLKKGVPLGQVCKKTKLTPGILRRNGLPVPQDYKS